MKRFIPLIAVSLFISSANAQKLVIGEKAPEIKASQWLWGRPVDDGKPILIEFFHPGSSHCKGRICDMESVAVKFKGQLTVILLSKESAASVAKVTGKDGTYFAAVNDAGKTLESFGVKFVPYGVLIDRRGRIVWFGNPSSLSEGEIRKLIN